jgi:ABC-type nitrate/sulfonate/bicarbonate transport system substrate-binding protein
MSHLTGLRRVAVIGAFLAAFGLLSAACGGDDAGTSAEDHPSGLDPLRMTFMAGFKPQANLPFVGAYVAEEKGFFEALNLDVTIRHAQSGEHLQLLLAGEVQVATANAAQVVQRNAEGLPVVSVALVGQRSEQGFAVGANSGIESVLDWEGKRFGYKGSVPVEFLAIARAAGLDPSTVEAMRVSFDPRVLSEGQVDILAVFVSNEPGQLERIGYPVRVFDPSEYDIPVLGLTYIASHDGIERHSEAIRRFVTAALQGIAYATENPEEALEIVMKFAPQENREQQEFMLRTELERARSELTEARGHGWQTAEQWQALAGALLEFEVIEGEVDVSSLFTTRFLGSDGE